MSRAPTLERFRELLDVYRSKYRRQDVPRLEVHELYDLFPDDTTPSDRPRWPSPWDGSASAGVYVILDADRQVLYVGKASMGSAVGNRLGSYFQDDAGRCVVVHDWTSPPRFVLVVSVPDELHFEAPALEEYLIAALDPPDNSVGRTRSQSP